jgi:hypothetical protein
MNHQYLLNSELKNLELVNVKSDAGIRLAGGIFLFHEFGNDANPTDKINKREVSTWVEDDLFNVSNGIEIINVDVKSEQVKALEFVNNGIENGLSVYDANEQMMADDEAFSFTQRNPAESRLTILAVLVFGFLLGVLFRLPG